MTLRQGCPGRAGFAFSDLLLVLAGLALAAAMVYPDMRRRSQEERIDGAAAMVDAAAAAARAFRETRGRWPADGDGGVLPAAAGGAAARVSGYRVDWVRWEREVERSDPGEAPPVEGAPEPGGDAVPILEELGAVRLVTGDSVLAAALLDRYGRNRSLVRDSVWLLPLDGGGGS